MAERVPIIVWIAIAGLGTYLVAKLGFDAELQRLKKSAKDKLALPPGLDRLPRPDYAVEIPTSKQDINGIDILICEAFTKPNPRSEQYLYVLGELYPDFEWPAIYADHPSTQQLQGIVQFRIDQAYAMVPNDPKESEDKFCAAVLPQAGFDPANP